MAPWLRKRFVSIQIPFADLRCAQLEGGRLAKPSWPDPVVGQDFIRGVGIVTARRLGGSPIWLGESAYCNFGRLIRIEPVAGFRNVYQRCFGSKWGYRLDIGQVIEGGLVPHHGLVDLRAIATSALNQGVSVAGDPNRALKLQFGRIAQVIETQTQKQPSNIAGLLRPGDQVLLIEDLLVGSEKPTVVLTQVVANNRLVDILHITRPFGAESEADRRRVRLFRLAWWRAHSELEALRAFLRAWNIHEIDANQAFRDLLDDLGHGLLRWRRDGVNQAQVIAWRSTQHPDELDHLQSMADLLLDESKGIARKVQLIVERARDARAAAELLSNVDPSQPLNVELFTTSVKIKGGTGIAVGTGATAITQLTDVENPDMDPVSIVVAALVAGAATGATTLASDAIGDAYKGFKGLLKRLFSKNGDTEAERTVGELERDSKGDEAALRTKLAAQNVDEDKELIAAARKVLAVADPDGYQSGKYNVTVTDSKGVQVGDYGTQTNTFN